MTVPAVADQSVDYDHLLDVIEEVHAAAPVSNPRSADLEFEAAEYALRSARAFAAMSALEIDAVVLSAPANVRYFTGLRTWLWKPLAPTMAILSARAGSVTIVGSTMDAEGIGQTTWPPARLYPPAASPADATAAALSDLGLSRGRIGFELGAEQLSYITAAVLSDVSRSLPEAEFVDAIPVASSVRMLKSPVEIERLRTAAGITEEGFAAGFAAAADGVTEAELARIAASQMILRGSLPAFAPLTLICRAGPSSYPRLLQPPGEQAVRHGQQIFFDGGCEFRGYQTDIMRSAVIGRLADQLEEHFARLDEAIGFAISSLKPGQRLGDVRAAVATLAESHGLSSPDEIYGIGHGIGLDRWELPLISAHPPNSRIRARAGMVLCVEPSLGLPVGATKRSGLFLMEDEVLITPDGAEVISASTPRSLRRLP
jgi:Xaa-Pro aminopeptidase